MVLNLMALIHVSPHMHKPRSKEGNEAHNLEDEKESENILIGINTASPTKQNCRR
jgi:hypothetical protein